MKEIKTDKSSNLTACVCSCSFAQFIVIAPFGITHHQQKGNNMDFQARMEKLLKASPEVLARIDEILEGKDLPQAKAEHTRLLSIAEARGFLGWSYPKLRRAIADGLLDVVTATGRRLVREESLYELASGRRQPSAEVRARREARNAARREEYRRNKVRLAGAA